MSYLWTGRGEPALNLYLVRHGETAWNVEERIQGNTDVPMTPRGEEAAERLARRLEGTRLDAIYASDLARALRTAEIIRKKTPAPLELVPAIRERNWGCLEGLDWAEIVRDHPDAAERIRMGDMDFAPEGGESRYQVIRRVLEWVNRVVEERMGKTILVVTHGGVSAVIIKHALGIDFGSRTPFAVSNCSLSHLVCSGASTWFVRTLNDTAHLGEKVTGDG